MLQLGFGIALVALGIVVGVQHFLIAEYLKYQVEQLARGVFTQLVGLALLQRQHLAHRTRQACMREPLAVVFYA